MGNKLESLEVLSSSFLEDFSLGKLENSANWHEEKDRFLRTLMKNVLQFTSQKQIRYYLRWYQDRIVRLSDQIFLNLQVS